MSITSSAVVQYPLFKIDSNKRYESVSKEMLRCFKSKKNINLEILYLSLETCYYGIFIPVYFSLKLSPYFNIFALVIYFLFSWINCNVFMFAYLYYKRSAEFYFHTKIFGHWKLVANISAEKKQ
jgi:hypothetical protein